MEARISVFGGTGFVGRRLVERLVARGATVRVVSRGRAGNAVPGAEHLAGSIEDPACVERALEDATAAVNLVGTTAARSDGEFYALHRDAPRRMVQAVRCAGVKRFVHVSAMGVAPLAPSVADRSKAAGESAVRDVFPATIIVRPALVYGPDDHFFALFAPLVRRAPAVPLLGGGRTRFQPIHVDDLAEAMARALEQPGTPGRTYDLGADEVFTLRQLIEQLCEAFGRRPWLVPVPLPLAEAGAFLTQRLPKAPLTLDQVRLLMTDKVIGEGAGTPAALGVQPRKLAEYVPQLRERFA